ncbi:MAG TPA: phosphatidate cytidylyltransferase [Aestuariivirga sp.]|jgi:phosphatidate cytidylyltransferase|nr:phosphatidate cytidylyltransferase [Hyphomicrobiales bacterium]HQY72353.1 phosphatidate cytidylyltransferase [Aestuariivirga sp.]
MTSAKWGDLGTRTASALILIPAVVVCAWFGGIWFKALILVLAALMAHEWVSMVHPKNYLQYALHMGAALGGAILPDLAGFEIALLVILGLALVSAVIVRFGSVSPSKWSYFGVLYVGCPALALVLLRADPDYGFFAILWIFLIVWSADSLAYFAGRVIGGPKLAPLISPKKTWAGLGGAVAGSALISIIFSYVSQMDGMWALAFLAGGLALVEQAGDLFESSLKRFHGVKDAGGLIPGHGGVIDRVDGLIVVAVAAALIGIFRSDGAHAARGLLLW